VRSLVNLTCSEAYPDRVLAGLCLEELVLPGRSLKRRVETVRLVASNVNERTTSVDLDLQNARELCSSVGVSLDCAVISLLPKSLIYDFDLRDAASTAVSALDRQVDSRASMCLLVALATSRKEGLPGLPLPSGEVWRCLYEHVYKFPAIDTTPRNLAFALNIGSELQGADAAWWRTACLTSDWRDWLLRLGDMFMLMARVGPAVDNCIYKFRRRSGRDPIRNHRIRQIMNGRTAPNRPLAIRLYDIGHAQSEHIHVIAPEGTFLSGGLPAGRPSKDSTYRRRSSRHELVFYTRDAKIGNLLLLANLWPEARGFVTPLRFISWYSTALLFVASAAQGAGIARHISHSADALFALLFFAPSIALGYLYRPNEENEIRWRLLVPARDYAGLTVISSLVACFSMLLPSSGAGRWALATIVFLLFFFSFGVSMHADRFARVINNANGKMKDYELREPKGRRLLLRRIEAE
jgi:hypothetical protein